MSYIINNIVSKPDWTTKIDNKDIINKWMNELHNVGISDNKINIIIKLLKQMKNNNSTLQEYDWFNKLEFNVNDIYNYSCDCKCEICKGNENSINQNITYYKSVCKCVKINMNCRFTFLSKFINSRHTNFNQSDLIDSIFCILIIITIHTGVY